MLKSDKNRNIMTGSYYTEMRLCAHGAELCNNDKHLCNIPSERSCLYQINCSFHFSSERIFGH